MRDLKNFVEDNNILNEEQVFFRSSHSAIDHIYTLSSIINWYLNKGTWLYCAFVDYQKVFDYISRVILWKKLMNLDIRGNIFTVNYNLYAKAKSCVQVNAEMSDLVSCNV